MTLIGDAAFCVSLLAGEGSALAMATAYILAGELHRANGDYATAFASVPGTVRTLCFKKQKAALRFGGTFAPKSTLSLGLRKQIMNLLTIPWVANHAFARDFTDNITRPEY